MEGLRGEAKWVVHGVCPVQRQTPAGGLSSALNKDGSFRGDRATFPRVVYSGILGAGLVRASQGPLGRHSTPRWAAMDQIAEWLAKLGMSEYAERFAENRIDFAVLPDLTDQDLKDIGVVLGDRRKILRAIARLDARRRQWFWS